MLERSVFSVVVLCLQGLLRRGLLFALLGALIVLFGCVGRVPYSSKPIDDCPHGSCAKAPAYQKESKASDNAVKYYSQLWNGAISSASFMEIKSADKQTGLITTGWYEGSAHKGIRFMINVLVIKGAKPSPAGYRVKVKKQTKVDKRWVDEAVDPRLGYEIARRMYNRSKKLKIVATMK